jgi:hypothetical protein
VIADTKLTVRALPVAVVWVVYVGLHVVFRALWLPADIIVGVVAVIGWRRGWSRSRIVSACTLGAGVLSLVGGAFLWYLVEVALPHSFGHMFGAARMAGP